VAITCGEIAFLCPGLALVARRSGPLLAGLAVISLITGLTMAMVGRRLASRITVPSAT
jgi:hypothetical protein